MNITAQKNIPSAMYEKPKDYTGTFVWMIFIFFIWGFLTSLNDILIPHLKKVFALTYTQAMLVQFCFFLAYFIVSIPAGSFIGRFGYKRGIMGGLFLAAAGCFLFIPSALLKSYPMFLGALFILASGLTMLQVASNPYVAVLGKPEHASSRLNLTQAFNSLGTTLAPLFGVYLILCSNCVDAIAEAKSVQLPYLLLGIALLVVVAVFSKRKLPPISIEDKTRDEGGSIRGFRHLKLGIVSIFFDVGAEVTIGSFLVSFLTSPQVAGMTTEGAGKYVSFYWGAAMVGRFVGFFLLKKIKANYLLAFNAIAAIVCIALALALKGNVAVYAMTGVGFFNSVLFANNFSLAIEGLGRYTNRASGLLCMAIVGGAVIPLLQGILADKFGLFFSYIIPIICYAYVLFYGAYGYKPTARHSYTQQP